MPGRQVRGGIVGVGVGEQLGVDDGHRCRRTTRHSHDTRPTERGAVVVIRAYRPADEDEIIAVWLASTIPGQAFLPEAHWRAMEPVVRERLMPVAETWVVEEQGRIVAFMSLLGDLIGGLFTHPDHQGEGYGRELVEHARAHHDQVLVEVFEANTAAISFYHHCGFVAHGRRLDEESGLPQLILRLSDREAA